MRRRTGNVRGCGGLEARAAVVAPDAAAHDEARPGRAEVARRGGRRRREQRERAQRRGEEEGLAEGCHCLLPSPFGTDTSGSAAGTGRARVESVKWRWGREGCECVGRWAAGGAKRNNGRPLVSSGWWGRRGIMSACGGGVRAPHGESVRDAVANLVLRPLFC